ncbi:lysophospholipase [Myxococcota bacterium]|nr:lysophospholipase [Myxococcota bacterium]
MTKAPHPRVVLVHGMGRTAASMVPLARALQRAGFEPHRVGYASRTSTIAECAETLATRVRALDAIDAPIHFVGHSLGNILIRWILHHERPRHVGRIVMLAPPNQGSALADRLAPTWVSKVLRPLPELTTGDASVPKRLPPPGADVEFGVIAGEWDGKVQIAETHLDGERDHVVVRSGHTFIMARPAVHALILRFLTTGAFGARGKPSAAAEHRKVSSRSI